MHVCREAAEFSCILKEGVDYITWRWLKILPFCWYTSCGVLGAEAFKKGEGLLHRLYALLSIIKHLKCFLNQSPPKKAEPEKQIQLELNVPSAGTLFLAGVQSHLESG